MFLLKCSTINLEIQGYAEQHNSTVIVFSMNLKVNCVTCMKRGHCKIFKSIKEAGGSTLCSSKLHKFSKNISYHQRR